MAVNTTKSGLAASQARGPRRCLSSGCAAQMVQQQFESLFPGRVLRVHMAHDTREIDSLVSEYWRLRRKLLDQLDEYSEHRRRQRPVKPAQACLSMSVDDE